jgi:hypothetical protein
MRTLLAALAVAALGVALPVGGAAAVSPTFRMTIIHTVSGCHVWQVGSKSLSPSARIVLERGTRLQIRAGCPMDFDFRQVAGPTLALGARRTYGGTTRTIVFRRAGVYRLVVTNVQSSAERGFQTLGPDNTLSLRIVVR